MGGLGPGIGGLEYLLIAAVALIVIGPERLPGVLRKMGQMLGKARRMADDFRASFDEMARQTELDELRKEVEALRTNNSVVRLGAEADEAFKDIKTELNRTDDGSRAVMDPDPKPPVADEWPEPAMTPLDTPVAVEPEGVAEPALKPVEAKPRQPRSRAEPSAATPAAAEPAPKAKAAATPAKPRAPRKTTPRKATT